MLSINMNQDVEQYQEPVVAGFNARQTIYGLLALAAGSALVCILYFVCKVPLIGGIYAAMPLCAVIMLPALGKQYGLTVTERIRGSNRRGRVLLYGSTAVDSKKENGKDAKSVKERKKKQKKENQKKGTFLKNQKQAGASL